jgi:hypothetical protein
MDALGKYFEANMTIQDEEQWAQNVQGYMRGLPKPGSMSEAAPILIQLKQWQEKTLEMVEHDRAQDSDDDIQKRIQNMSILLL